jgi:putative MATE family efflux protein
MDKQEKTADLGTGSIGKLMVRLAIPMVMAQLINVLYNMVDRMYIGNIEGIGATALTGVGVTFPIILIISAFSAFVGTGGAPLASIKLGEGNRKGAEEILGTGVAMLAVLSAVLMAFFFVFRQPMLLAFGASENTIGYAMEYITIYLIGTPFVQFALGLNPYISAQGNARTAMLSVLIGAVLNIVLDPIFIFGFDMGVSGAALATILSQAASAVWVVCFLAGKKSTIRLRPSRIRLNPQRIGKIAALGISPFIMQATESLVQVVLNRGMLQYGGDLYVGTMTIILSVSQLFIVPISGFTNGIHPILSYNFGAKKFDRVRETFKKTLVVTLILSTLATVLTELFPQAFVRMFNSDPQLVELTCKGMRIYMAGVFMFGIQMACQAAFLSLGQARLSLVSALMRKVVLLVPLALIFPHFLGVNGVYLAEPVADIGAAIFIGVLFVLNFEKILARRAKEDV